MKLFIFSKKCRFLSPTKKYSLGLTSDSAARMHERCGMNVAIRPTLHIITCSIGNKHITVTFIHVLLDAPSAQLHSLFHPSPVLSARGHTFSRVLSAHKRTPKSAGKGIPRACKPLASRSAPPPPRLRPRERGGTGSGHLENISSAKSGMIKH